MAKVIYRVASNPGDYGQCHQLMREEDMQKPDAPLTFPTILVIEGLQLVGFLATRIYHKRAVAGPLVLRSDRTRVFTAIRLIESYETAMRNLGIKHFIFSTEEGGFLEKARERYYPSLTPYAVVDGKRFYLWELNDEQRLWKLTA